MTKPWTKKAHEKKALKEKKKDRTIVKKTQVPEFSVDEFVGSLKNLLNKYLAEYTHGKTSEEKMIELCERDNFLPAKEALKIGLIDQIVSSREEMREATNE